MKKGKIILMMAVGAFAFTASSCADDALQSPTTSERQIRFGVSTVEGGWKSGKTRGDTPLCSVITLSEGNSILNSPLYLVPAVSEGINQVDRKSTRGSQTDNSTINSFGVFASMTGGNGNPDYMFNEEITADNGWSPSREFLWPGSGSLHFNAYSPYIASAGEQGVTRLPAVTDTGDLTLDFSVASDVKDQVDLMYSTARDASASPCDLEFNHALTALRFAAGSEMAPCTVTSISIDGIKNSATLNLESGDWSGIDGEASYTVNPDVTLAAESGSAYVAAGTPITSGDNTFLLIPQTLGEDASISVTVKSEGKSVTLTAPLANQTWEAGKTVVYRLSANPNPETLILDVEGDLATKYTGGSDTYTVRSSYSNGTETTPVKWIAEFVDDKGNVIDQPNWITSFVKGGTGDKECTAITDLQNLIFNKISPESQILQNASDINQTSGYTPYNLSSSTGNAGVENTANTYVVNAPGKYSLPLVYGNAVKNGAANQSAYTSTSHNSRALKTFINHLGNDISDPYIYNNAGCGANDAVLLWEDQLGLVRNVTLSADKKTIEFEIPQNSIRQGNALVGVRDDDGKIMWSWQIWVTDYVNGSGTIAITSGGHDIKLYPRSVGQILGGDVVTFTPQSVKVRFTQTDVPAGLEPLTKTVEFQQTGITITTPDTFSYYQWGRKDPMMSDVTHWYDTAHQEHTSISTLDYNDLPAGENVEEFWIQNPQYFWKGDHNYVYQYLNLWNANLSTSAYVKTIYDPSPVGAMVPGAEVLRNAFLNSTAEFQDAATSGHNGFNVTLTNGEQIFFFALGYRSSSLGTTTGSGNVSEYWTNGALTNRTEARSLVISHSTSGSSTASVLQEPRGHGFGIRPSLEQ